MPIQEILKRAAKEQDRLQKEETTPTLVQKAGSPDAELMSSLLKRTSVLEKHVITYQKELKDKNAMIDGLRSKLEIIEKASSGKKEEVSYLETLKVNNLVIAE